MALLFRQRGEGEVKIAAEVVKAAAGNTESEKDAMASLPQQQGTRGVQKVMELLLERCRDEAMITQEVVKEAACNPHGKGTLEFLLEKDPRYQSQQTSSEQLHAAKLAKRRSSFS
jgi:hypothetical protein